MKIYVVSAFEDIYGVFSSLEKAKSYVNDLVKRDIDNDDDLLEPYYSVDSFELDKEYDFSKEIPRFEWAVDGDEEILSNDNDK